MLIPLPFGALEGHIKPPKMLGFEAEDLDLVQAWDVCNI
jgi:hypothetical protein